jgi:hypothetical protein
LRDTMPRRGRDSEIDFDQGFAPSDREFSPLFEGRYSMPTETILVVVAIIAAFSVFGLSLWRAERLTRDLKRD